MATPRISRREAERRFAAIAAALQAGGKPPDHAVNHRRGERGALRLACDALGFPSGGANTWLKAAERVLGPYPWPAHEDEVHGRTGAHLPDPLKPAAGFEVRREAVRVDAAGRVVSHSVETRPELGEPYQVPPGYAIKGESALVDADGRLQSRWIKTREGAVGAGLVEALQQAFAAHRGAAIVPQAPLLPAADLLTVYPLPDLHVGLYSWGRETGDSYDTDIAVARTVEMVGGLLAQSPPSRHAVLLGLGDYFHQNDQTNATPASKHRLEVDGRWPRVYAAGARLVVSLVELLAAKHQSLELVMLPGNHDPDASICLTVSLAMFYAGHERIAVHDEPGLTWYRRHGAVLLGATHGHTLRPDRMAMMLAADRPEDWGEAKHRHFFFGHVHSESAREVGPVRVESFNTPAARDAWNSAAGYRAGQSLSAITFHAAHGEIMRHRVNLPPRPRVRVRAARSGEE
jgi:hypothetical protein